jgi:hypothetical protein
MRTVILISLLSITLIACNRSSSTDSGGDTNKLGISRGRVELVQYKVEFGDVNDMLVRQGMERAITALNTLIEEEAEAGRVVHGTIDGSFRLEADGIVRMYLEGNSTLQNEGETSISEKFTGEVFGKKFSFPALGQPCLVSWKCAINTNK